VSAPIAGRAATPGGSASTVASASREDTARAHRPRSACRET
jgi:hypothetical protein